MIERLTEALQQFTVQAVDYLSGPVVLMQVGMVLVAWLVALLLAKVTEAFLEEQARKIKGMPGLLRLIVAFLRRLRWFFFAILLGGTYELTSIVAWPDSNYLIYVALTMASAWLVISVVSHAIRSRLVRTAVSWAAWFYVAAAILGINDDIASMLDNAGFSLGSVRISVLGMLQAAVIFAVAMWASYAAGSFLDRRIQKVDELTPSLRVLLGKITRITLMVLAALVAISGLGIDLTALTVLSGAVGVGIGFGLQKVVSNFISGIIILVDQSIKPGDTISLGETFGWIRELRARFVSVVTRDGREFLIPNEDFITHEVINWSFSDKFVRLDVDFGVSYDADPHEVMRIAPEAASGVGRVDASGRPPVCWLTEFGDSSLNFKLRFWISDPQQGLTNIKGKVMIALWDAFKEAGIGIPYPHREVIMKTPVTVESPAGKPSD